MTTKPVPAGCGQRRWPERRVNWPDTIPTDLGTLPPAEAATEVGADDNAADSMWRFRRVRSTVVLAVALVAICYVIANFLPALN